MGLFKKQIHEIVKIEKSFQKKELFSFFIKSIIELGDYEDYKVVSLKAADLFFEENKNIFKNLITISEDNLNLLIDLVNCFFANYNLGSVEMEIDEVKGEVIIIHYKSPFINIVEGKKNCIFLSEFYKELFEFIIDTKVNVEETECGGNNEKCIFKISN